MKTRIHNLIILDESGSMESIKRAAINGMNETVQSRNFSLKMTPPYSTSVISEREDNPSETGY